jgi:serine phosphatase RsbU (regulator of sigma subunit)
MKFSDADIARLASFPKQNPNPVVEMCYDSGDTMYLNPAAEKHFPEIENLGFKHPLLSEVNKRISLKKDFNCEVAVGSSVFEQKVFFIENSTLVRIYSSDITVIKQIEKNLSRLASFPEQNPSPIFEVDMNRNITYFNPAALIHFPDFYEKKMEHPILAGLKNNFEKFKTGTLQVFTQEIKYGDKHYDQRIRFMADGNVLRMFNIDITEMKRAEEIIKEKNKDITDSINYARKIQQAILPPDEILKKAYPDSFVLYKPKDIISGDFYWYQDTGDYLLLACADCTGHGVPGALMSMIGSNFITHIVNEKEITSPDLALAELDKRVRIALRQDIETDSKDGMDIALCAFQKEKRILHYAGANRPIILVRNGKLTEYAPSKFPIGGQSGIEKKFVDNKIQLEAGDRIYLSTDGYADQFGGPKGKKLMKKNFYELLVKIHTQPMQEQKNTLLETIEEWRGELEQVDDILVIGFYIP